MIQGGAEVEVRRRQVQFGARQGRGKVEARQERQSQGAGKAEAWLRQGTYRATGGRQCGGKLDNLEAR